MNWITNSAAIVVTDSGSSVSQKKTKRTGAVDPRCLEQFLRDRHEELPEQQRARGGCDQRHDQSGIGVEHMQIGDHLVGRIDPHLDRQHQRDEDDPERGLAERKTEIHDRVS